MKLMITELLGNEEMSYILLLQRKFNTFFPGCSTQDRLPTGGFQLEVNIEMKMISGTWRAWEEEVVFGDSFVQTFLPMLLLANTRFQKRQHGRSNRGKSGGNSSVNITCNLVGLSVLGD